MSASSPVHTQRHIPESRGVSPAKRLLPPTLIISNSTCMDAHHETVASLDRVRFLPVTLQARHLFNCQMQQAAPLRSEHLEFADSLSPKALSASFVPRQPPSGGIPGCNKLPLAAESSEPKGACEYSVHTPWHDDANQYRD